MTLYVHDVTHRDDMPHQPFCGPAAISAITGRMAECAAAWINTRRQDPIDKIVEGTYLLETLWALRALGYATSIEGQAPHPLIRPTLTQWFHHLREDANKLYLLATHEHWMVVQGDDVLCSNQPVRNNITNAILRENPVNAAMFIELLDLKRAALEEEPMPGSKLTIKLTPRAKKFTIRGKLRP